MDCCNLAFLFVLLLSALGCCTGQNRALPPGDINALVGKNVTFTTIIDPVTQQFIVITWTFNSGSGPVSVVSSATKGVVVSPKYENRVVLNRTTGSLILKDVTTSDTGDYTLTMVQDSGTQIPGEVKLIVYEPASAAAIEASVTDAVEFNDTVEITCTATGTELVYSWLSGGTALKTSDRIQPSGEDGSKLIISDIQRSDKGPFACRVSNPLSETTSESLSLNISYGPENIAMTSSPEMAIYSIGSNISLSCSAESSPPAVFEWLYNGESLKKPGAELKLEDIKEDQGGNYSCLASNEKTKRFLSSNVAQIRLLEKISGAKVTGPTALLLAGNSSANISCQAAGGTITTIEWQKDGKPLSPSDRVTFSEEKSSVAISPVEKADTGVYQCTLSNAVSTDSDSYEMTVNYGPGICIIKGSDEIEVDQPLELTCSAPSEPPATYSWTFNGTQKDVQTAMYSLEKAVFMDSGKYECVARNNVTGQKSSAIHILSVKEKGELGGLSGGAIAGIVIAVLVGLVLIAAIAHCMTKNKKVTESPY